MSKKYYIVGVIFNKKEIEIGTFPESYRSSLELTWTDGMYGVSPVFTNKRKAERYAKKIGNQQIIEVIGAKIDK